MIILEIPILISKIEAARAYERIWAWELEAEILQEFWTDFGDDVDTEGLSDFLQAELTRLCGYFLIAYGRAKAHSEFQERGKNLLTRAREMFIAQNDLNKLTETNCQLALSYCYDGRAAEADAILSESANFFTDPTDQAYLQIKINQLVALNYLGELPAVRQTIREITTAVDNCGQPFLSIMFYNQYGYTCGLLHNYSEAVSKYLIALKYSIQTENRRVIAQTSNNLAYAYFHLGDFEKAYAYIKQAKAIALSLGDVGWLANYLDTKANIELCMGLLVEAQDTIDHSIRLLQRTGDPLSLSESLWTKVEIMIALNDLPGAAVAFAELKTIAASVSEKQAQKFDEQFTARLEIKNNNNDTAPDAVGLFTAGDVEIFNLPPETDYLLFVPAKFAKICGAENEIIVAVQKKTFECRTNPVVLTDKQTGEHFVGYYEREFWNIEEGLSFYVLKAANDFPHTFAPDEVFYSGSITAVAARKDFKDGFLYFEKFQ